MKISPKIYLRSTLLFLVMLVIGCHDKDDPKPHPPEQPTVPIPAGQRTAINLSLSALPWQQDSLTAVNVAFSEITLTAAEGFEWSWKVDSTTVYNLADLNQFPVNLVNDSIRAGKYISVSLKMRSFLLHRKGKNKGKDWNWHWWNWWYYHGHNDRDKEEYEVTLTHYPQGNHSKAQTLTVDVCSVEDHLKHGDTPGKNNKSYSKGSTLFNHMLYKDSKKNKPLTPLFMPEDLVYTDSMEIDIPQVNTVEARLTINAAESVVAFEPKKKASFFDPCKRIFLFNPVFDFVILPSGGNISGNYIGTPAAGRVYTVYLYETGKYSKTEENASNLFPNALMQVPLSAQRTFLLENVPTGTYDVILAEFQSNRLRGIVGRTNNIAVRANETKSVRIEN